MAKMTREAVDEAAVAMIKANLKVGEVKYESITATAALIEVVGAPPATIIGLDGKEWHRVSPSRKVARAGWLAPKRNGIAFTRMLEGRLRIVSLPYATYRRSSEYRHLGIDQIVAGREIVPALAVKWE